MKNEKYTRQQRADLYKTAAENIGKHTKINRFACHEIGDAICSLYSIDGGTYQNVTEENFPEFYMFKDKGTGSVWLGGDKNAPDLGPSTEEGIKLREVVLWFAYEMCQD
jgi:hypothetical protein